MSNDERGWLASRWDRLPTGLKMLAILSLGLLPLGFIAIAASIDNARESRQRIGVEAQALLAVHVQRFTLALTRNAAMIRSGRDAILESPEAQGICRRTLDRLAHLPVGDGRYALFGEGPAARCVTPGFAAPRPLPARREGGRARISPDGQLLYIFFHDGSGAIEGIAEYPRDALARVVNHPPMAGNFSLELVQDNRSMPLRTGSGEDGRSRSVQADFPFLGGEFALRIRAAAAPLGLSEIVAILAPVLMWLWASLVGWVLVQRLLLRPLRRLEAMVSAYKPGDRNLDLAKIRSPAREIGTLGEAFDRVVRTVARHEDDLEAAVDRQKRLVREVHHRVKNNLQVVASLLNLHSRGAREEAISAAYASIQRRVDALAVVHRNHFAELEENRGVALRPLISELAANLRATAPPEALGMQIRLDAAPLHAGQDVAVSVAFLVTEICEFGMLCGASRVSIMLEGSAPGTARLAIEVDSLVGTPQCDEILAERFERIVTGLARQLRSPLERDPTRGRYALDIAVVDGALT